MKLYQVLPAYSTAVNIDKDGFTYTVIKSGTIDISESANVRGIDRVELDRSVDWDAPTILTDNQTFWYVKIVSQTHISKHTPLVEPAILQALGIDNFDELPSHLRRGAYVLGLRKL